MNTPYTQVITATDGVWTAGGNAGVLSPDAADLAVARGDSAAFFANRTAGGTRSAMLTTPLAPGLALQVAESLSKTDVEVASVGATLTVLSAIGIVAATVLGWAVARAGLAPVARLAGVTELASGETSAAGWGAWGPARLDEVAATAVEAARRDWPKTEFSAELDSCVVRAAPTGCGWRSGTCWTTRRSSARLRGRWPCGWRVADGAGPRARHQSR